MPTDLLTQLKTLHLYGMAEAWAEIQAEAIRQPPWSAEQVIQGEMTDRQARSLRYQLHAAKFPIHRDWWLSTGAKRRYHRRTLSNWRAPALWPNPTI